MSEHAKDQYQGGDVNLGACQSREEQVGGNYYV